MKNVLQYCWGYPTLVVERASGQFIIVRESPSLKLAFRVKKEPKSLNTGIKVQVQEEILLELSHTKRH
jgi:hypothetical protein